MLRGKVPDFTVSDIKLAFTINGEEQNGVLFPNKGDGYAIDNVTCKNGVTAEWNYSLWGLVNIKNNGSSKIECTINFASEFLLSEVAEIGKYVEYNPSIKSYTIPVGTTGYAQNQTINPSELNLWRIIKINVDGTMYSLL